MWKEIARTGTYVQTHDELSYGCKIAWRNSVHCIGRIFWPGMQVIDARHLRDEREIFNALVDHLRYATNGGAHPVPDDLLLADRRSSPGTHQLIRYAGYYASRTAVSSAIRPRSKSRITRACIRLARRKAHPVRCPAADHPGDEDRPPQWFEIPEDAVLEVPIVHPKFRWFEELNLKWHAVPIASDNGFDMGGIKYHLMPFNGWYMSAEIGSRNFCDPFRYDMVPVIAEKMGLDMSSEASLWRDRAMVEMNTAPVLHSYGRMGVTLIDHHTVTCKFMEYVAAERALGREVYADWAWTGSAPVQPRETPVFHTPFQDVKYKPMLFRMPRPWEVTEQPEAAPAH